ncbi:stemmadenine O-acetyltransferase [Eucalyptus grandis]|nr:stemmadenine O-acetyltransferase [Eucalyptus grandis]
MEIAVEITSRETVKPSSPTPDHLRHYRLSFLDQISPPVYNPFVLFYTPQNEDDQFNIDDISSKLKASLSCILTHFYPLAGRLKGNVSIECDDVGVPYSEAIVKCQVSDVTENPDPQELGKLLPFVLDVSDETTLGVQFNKFDCGGIAVGICMSHKISDALSLLTFIKMWAAVCRGEEIVTPPQFASAELFPPKNISGFEPRTGITRDNIVSKRFIFKTNKIETLKARYSKEMDLGQNRPPSRVEALSTFIWSRFAWSTRVYSEPSKKCIILHAVNLRTKFDPPLPQHSFGNFYRVAVTSLQLDSGKECYGLAAKMRETVRGIDKGYVEKLRDGKEHLDFIKRSAEVYLKGELLAMNFTSLCRFPMYESDFGWDNPTWVGSPALTFQNLVVFMDTKSGDGVEAYISLRVEDMAALESDEEFMEFVISPGKEHISV